MKKIPVNHPHESYEAIVDDEDYEFLVQHRWSASVRSNTTYANTSISTEHGFKCVSIHRMVIGDAEEDWNFTLGGYPPEKLLDNGKTIYFVPEKYRRRRRMTVDHMDGNGLNNTRANLRHLSCAEQLNNRRLYR